MGVPKTYDLDAFADDFCTKVKKVIAQVIRKSSLSRDQIVDRMNECAELSGQEPKMTVDILNSWTRNDPKRKINPNDIMYFCYATEGMEPIAILLQPFGGMWISREQLATYEYGVSKLEEFNLRQRIEYEKKIQELIEENRRMSCTVDKGRQDRITQLYRETLEWMEKKPQK